MMVSESLVLCFLLRGYVLLSSCVLRGYVLLLYELVITRYIQHSLALSLQSVKSIKLPALAAYDCRIRVVLFLIQPF